MLQVQVIIVGLICAAPAILLVDQSIAQGFLAAVVAAALVIAMCTLRQGEMEFLALVIRPLLVVAVIPALWMLIQVAPLPFLAHPFWTSAESALNRPIVGTISIDPGASVIALGQYLSMVALMSVTAAVAVERQRAKWILFALTGVAAIIGLIIVAHGLFFRSILLTRFMTAEAITCEALGTMFAASVCVGAIERHETRHSRLVRWGPPFLGTVAAGSAAFVICLTALALNAPAGTMFACGCGLLAFACIVIIRRFAFGPMGIGVVALLALGVATFVATSHPVERGRKLLLTFAASSSPSLSMSERVLADAPLTGTGAGTFASVAPIYREMDDPAPGPAASTAAATVAIELGEPMLWSVAAGAGCAILFLLRASLRRGRDSFYPAMGGSCLITLLLLAFVNAGVLGLSASLMGATTLGLAFAQSRSRTLKFGDLAINQTSI